MTACAVEATAGESRTVWPTRFTIAADGAYAARLKTSADGGWYPERWTLDGPEPYAVPLPGPRREEPGSAVLPLTDGRVLIARHGQGHWPLALLYPTGPGTGELCLGAIESERLTLLPPAPCGQRAYGLVPGEHSTGVWLLTNGADALPQRVAEVPGRCSGGAWLDRFGRLLALDRTDTGGTGRTKTVVVDLGRGGEISPLLQITVDSDDRLLLADPDSGLLLVSSNAPGEERLGWGVLGSERPVRFPDSLRPRGAVLEPFAVQPGQALLPEHCGVALRGQLTSAGMGTGAGAGEQERSSRPAPKGSWLAVWNPARGELTNFPAPAGWLPGQGVWTREGELRLPCVTPHAPCGLARLRARPADAAAETTTGAGTGGGMGGGTGGGMGGGTGGGIAAGTFAGAGAGAGIRTDTGTGMGTDTGMGTGMGTGTDMGTCTSEQVRPGHEQPGTEAESTPPNAVADVRVAEPCLPLKPVPLQDAPLDLHLDPRIRMRPAPGPPHSPGKPSGRPPGRPPGTTDEVRGREEVLPARTA